MRILFINNIVSPHITPLLRAVASLVGPDRVAQAVLSRQPSWRRTMGWSEEVNSWILRPNESDDHRRQTEEWILQSDLVICSEREWGMIENRVKSGRLTFYAAERWFKPPLAEARLLSPRYLASTLKLRALAKYSALHYLPIGALAAGDMKKVVDFQRRVWRWGYFVDTPRLSTRPERAGDCLEVLYVGRLLNWKRVDLLVRAFASAQTRGARLRLTLIGDGPERASLERLSRRCQIPTARMRWLGYCEMKTVWEQMETSHVLVLPSNGGEGWGAVVGEAMGRGCAVVVNRAAGCAMTLITHEKNGLLFADGDAEELANCLVALARDEGKRAQLAKEGAATIANEWAPEIAAERLVQLTQSLQGGIALEFSSGPLSRVY